MSRYHDISFGVSKMRLVLVAAFVSCFSLAAMADDGPFGVHQGEKISELTDPKNIKDDIYSFSPTKTHPAFDGYAVIATKLAGVCKVIALTSTYDDDEFGERIKQKFADVKAQLTQKYGLSQDEDRLLDSDSMSEPKYWALSITHGKRVFGSFWIKGPAKSLPDGLDSIAMEVVGVNSRPQIRLSYDFDNLQNCIDENNRATSGAL